MPAPYPPFYLQMYRVKVRVYPQRRARRLFFVAYGKDGARRQAEEYCAWIYPRHDFRILRVRVR